MHVDGRIQAEIRTLVERGTSVADIVRHIRRATGTDAPGEGRGMVIAYMKKTFQIPLRDAATLGAWTGFEDGDGSVTDEQLEAELRRYLA